MIPDLTKGGYAYGSPFQHSVDQRHDVQHQLAPLPMVVPSTLVVVATGRLPFIEAVNANKNHR